MNEVSPPHVVTTEVGEIGEIGEVDVEIAARVAREPIVLPRGATVGRYVVLDRLGSGGMGIVYAAFDPELDRRVAIKLMRPGTQPRRAATARARLLREAQALARLSHPNVIAVHDVGTFEGQVFVAMEFVAGPSLGAWVGAQPRAWTETLEVFLAAGRGLAAAHTAGIVHRDFKPDNVLVGDDGRVRVLDFGLARGADDDTQQAQAGEIAADDHVHVHDHVHDHDRSGEPSALSTRLTQVGAIVGTPAYMSPEQHLGRRTDHRTDQFSFCVALWEALYGERPFAGKSSPEFMMSVLRGQVREPPRSPVPGWLRRALTVGLATLPAQRHADMASLLAALAPEQRTRRRRRLFAAGIVTMLTAAAVWAWPPASAGPAPCTGAERKLEGVWDDTVRARMRAAFLATETPYAEDAFSTSSRWLDDYAAQWVSIHTDACEATAIRKEQSQEMLDRQMVCLERHLREAAALTRLLGEADAAAVERAVTAVAQLPALSECADRGALARGDAPAEVAADESDVDETLAAARQQVRLGRYAQAEELAQAGLAAAQKVHALRQVASALLVRGEAESGRDAESAEGSLYEALWAADEAGDDRLRAEAWTKLVWVVGYQRRRADEVDRLAAHADHALVRSGGDDRVRAELHHNLGATARVQGDVPRARGHYEIALALRRRFGPHHPDVGSTLHNLALAHLHEGRFDEAEVALDEAQRIVEASYGPSHPRTAHVLHTRALLHYRRGDARAAVELLTRVVTLREASVGPTHRDTATALHDLAEARLLAGDAGGAAEAFERAAAIRRQRSPVDEVALANSLSGVGRARARLGERAAAIAALEQARAIWERTSGRNADQAETALALAELLADEDAARATELLAAALRLWGEGSVPQAEMERALALRTRLGPMPP